MRNLVRKIKIFKYIYLIANRYNSNLIEFIFNRPYPIKRDTILTIAKKHELDEIFIETGTFLGDTIESMKSHFKKAISIELSKELAVKAQKRFENDPNVNILCGDSSMILPQILKDIKTPALFWLDGHYSSEFFIGDEYIKTAMGETVTPILKEIKSIVNHNTKKHIILIDDARLFRGKGGYPTKSQIKKELKNTNYYYAGIINDIIKIYHN